MASDLSSFYDWLKISIKFSGICLNCKKKVNSGDIGYWSRKKKGVMHETCYEQVFQGITKPEEKSLITFKNTKCYICNSKINFNEDPVLSLINLPIAYKINDDIKFCSNCLMNFNKNIFSQYKQIFNRKV